MGQDEGETCGRGGGCEGVLELRHGLDDRGWERGCSCHISPPCCHCMSLVPECPVCGWRAEELR